ncbi:hypothetical protein ACP70R_046802 [Stipagrostis hirtigluma subsp. patula]
MDTGGAQVVHANEQANAPTAASSALVYSIATCVVIVYGALVVAVATAVVLTLLLCVLVRVRRGQGVMPSVVQVFFPFIVLLCVFMSNRMITRFPPGSLERAWLKASIWAVTAILTIQFIWSVSDLLPRQTVVVLGIIASVILVAGFYIVFLADIE